ncbi:SWIM zinc finger family protein [Micromonospora sp. DSM 115977]|uniref:SWIM zinc finger family protein n=1 Tax=Micromonospora reichwaldensis TaxID=3075516 RepID=A0ABU2WVA9_9ACTN|nr:SWIM zinc finger family protein [Micromonospora sp. DSM 115977]MDT0529873.1 SWIM zinc finger family protein [Micromonospora sp. DSM 115977]
MSGQGQGDGGANGRFADYGRPRRVDGGLRARSTRGAIGRSWWSQRFLEVLESFALGTRLTRGRSYARAGQVVRLEVAPGTVDAVVQGSRAQPYEVSIALPPFPEAIWARVEAELAAQAFFSARLLAGDLPPELEELFGAAGAPLFPAGVAELRQRCSCPDHAVPCKHLAATFYLLAEAFDADPFQLLHWRGRSRTQLLDRLRVLRATAAGADDQPAAPEAVPTAPSLPDGAVPPAAPSTSDGAAPAPPSMPDGAVAPTAESTRDGGVPGAGRDAVAVPPVGASRALAGLPPAPLAEAVDRFWLPPVPLPDRPPSLSTGPDLLLRQLGAPAPAIGGPGLLERLRRAYRLLGG